MASGRFLPVDPKRPVLNRVDAPDAEVDERRQEEEARQAMEQQQVDPNAVVHLLAVPNEGMMSGQPTNCYLLGRPAGDEPLTLIDAGRKGAGEIFDSAFGNAGIAPQRVTAIVLTHCHPDHVGGAIELKAMTGAEVYAPPLEREQIERFAPDLKVDRWIDHEEPLRVNGRTLIPIFTPGHAPGHIAFVEVETKLLIAGDMISGFGSVGIFPPNGSVAAYIDSLRRLLAAHEEHQFTAILPGHGPIIAEVREKVEEYIEHRLNREREIFDAVREHGPVTIDELLPVIYPDVLEHLNFAAKATLTTHLEKLVDEGRVHQEGDDFVVKD